MKSLFSFCYVILFLLRPFLDKKTRGLDPRCGWNQTMSRSRSRNEETR